MSDPIEFFFDFSSPYGYLAACRAAHLEQSTGRTLVFKPYLMGAVFKATGRQPLKNHPLVWDYARNDLARSARRLNISLSVPEPFPVVTASACRAFYWVSANDGADAARALAKRLFHAYFVDGANISKSDVVAGVVGGDREAVESVLNDEALKNDLRQRTDEAASRGIFGSPFFVVDGESFWGNDRIDDVIRWANGAW